MGKRITIDPITRIEGHLRIEVEVEGRTIRDAWASSQMWRGIEVILKGRDPEDAWVITQRICGVCTTVHAIASVRAVENALELEVPLNAQYIRNIIIGAHALHDHMVHFYHLSALDWVDVVSALKADPVKTAKIAQSISNWPYNGVSDFKAVQKKLKKFVESGQVGPFANGYWGHPSMKLPPEINLLAVTHYLQALEYQRYADSAAGILGGKNPHIQNLAIGGVANAINLENQSTLNMERLMKIKFLLEKVVPFVKEVYLPDVLAICSFYPEWLSYGKGVDNYLAVPDMPLDTKGTIFDLPGGTIFNGDLSKVTPIKSFNDPYFVDNIKESIYHSWYDGDWTKHPWEEDTVPKYTGYDTNKRYSWTKAPRFAKDERLYPMQVGPLSQVLVGYALGHPLIKRYVDFALSELRSLTGKRITIDHLKSTAGRHIARAIRAAVISELVLKHWDLLVSNISKGDTNIWNEYNFPDGEIRGVGFHEAPRGTLSHWVVIEKGKIKNYQAVVPSTWNSSPRDKKGRRGPYEESLIGNPVVDIKRPLEVLRTVHSFDPCIACAVHLFDPSKKEKFKVRVL